MDFKSLTVSLDGTVAHLRLTRPEVSNYVDELSHTEIPAALQYIGTWEEDVAALIVSAEGPHFMVGVDLDMVIRANASVKLRDRLLAEGMAIVDGLLDLPYPVIAALHGDAVGLGASIATCCDILVSARGVAIGDPHVMAGAVAGDGGVMGWSQAVGITRAKRYLLTGEPVLAEDALAMGLITDLVETPDEVMPAAAAIAQTISALPRRGVRGTKMAFARLGRSNYAAAFEYSFALEMQCMAGEEMLQTVQAVKERGGF